MKKEKEIIPPVMSIASLNEYDRQRWKKMEEKRLVVQREGEKVLVKALDEQARFHKELNKALGIVAKMEDDYIEIEKKIAAEKRAGVEKTSLKAEDVKAGRATMREFYAKGTSEAQRTKLACEQMTKELEDARAVIRAKRKEIIALELELHKQRQIVFAMRLRPAMDLVKAYRDHAKTLEIESSGLWDDRIGADSAVKIKEQELRLCDGKTLGAGHTFDGLTLNEAHKLVLNPIFPEHLIPELKEGLAKEDVEEPITIQLHFGLGGPNKAALTVRPTPQRGEIVTTSDKFGKKKKRESELESVEKESAEIKNKMLTTSDIDLTQDSKYIKKKEG